MSLIEDEFNKRFNNQQHPKDDFDAEGLWDDIANNLDDSEENPEDDSDGKPFFYIRYMLLALLFIGISTMGVYVISDDHSTVVVNEKKLGTKSDLIIYDKKETPSTEKKHTFLNESLQNSTTESATENNTKKIAKVNSTKISNTTSVLKPERSKQKTEQKINNNSFTKNKNSNLTNLNNLRSTNTESISTYKRERGLNKREERLNKTISSYKTIGSVPTSSIPTPTRDTQKSIAPAVEKSSIPTLDFEDLSILPLRWPLLKNKESVHPSLNLLDVTKATYSKIDPAKKTYQILIGAFGGLNKTDLTFRSNELGDFTALKSQLEKGNQGTSIGVTAAVLLKSRWLIGSGIEYHRLFSKFDYTSSTTIPVLKENQLLKVWIDNITADTLSAIYGDTIVNETTTRHIVHYNQYNQISIPVEIGFQKQTGKFIYGTQVGLTLNFTTAQSGRTLNMDSEVFEFDNDHDAAPFNKFDVGWRLSPFAGYKIYDKLAVTLRPQFTWRSKMKSGDIDLTVQPNYFNLNLGVQYNLR